MLNGFCNCIVTKDITDDIKKSIEELAKKEVLVGVPDATKHENSKISNAQLLYVHENGVRSKDMREEMQHNQDENGMTYSKAHEMYIHEHGSPMYAIPPRPVLVPAMDNSKDIIAEQMKKAAKASLDGKNPNVELEETGMLGQNICRDWFTNPANNWPANSEETIKRKGSDRPLIDSSQLRTHITYIVKDGND